MAGKFCTKCGSPTIVGKRFCGKCGQLIAQPALPPEDPSNAVITEPVRQEWSLPDSAPKAIVLSTLQTTTGDVQALNSSGLDEKIPPSRPSDNKQPAPISGVPEPAVGLGFSQSVIPDKGSPVPEEVNDLLASSLEAQSTPSVSVFGSAETTADNGSRPSLVFEADGPGSTDKLGAAATKSFVPSEPTSSQPGRHTGPIVGAAALVVILAGAVTWIYVSHTRAKIGQIPVTTGTAQPVNTPDTRGPSEHSAKPGAATPMATQQNLPSDSSQSIPSGDVLLKNMPKPLGYVNDFAHVLSPQVVAQLDRTCDQLDRSQANAQVAVVTIDTLNGADIADFAKQLFNKWGIGPKASNRGVLVLLAVNDRKYRIATGYGLESVLTDAKAAEIGRSAAPLLHANDFDRGVTAIVAQVTQVITDDTKARLDTAPVPIPPQPEPLSGVLHYTGSPVPFGGTVVFANLPGDRLSFTFDHQAWQPLISRQPDGTQKLTLRSLKQGEQTQCDVEWKAIK